MAKLTLDRDKIDRCRELSEHILKPINKYIQLHSTKAIERSTLRLLGLYDIWNDKSTNTSIPMANLVVDKLTPKQLSLGVSTWIASAKAKNPRLPINKLAVKIINGSIKINDLEEPKPEMVKKTLKPWIDEANKKLEHSKRVKDKKRYKGERHHGPLRTYVISSSQAEDAITQAQKAVNLGADSIIIKSSPNQNTLNYLPLAETDVESNLININHQTIKNLRQSLDELSEEYQRYIRLGFEGHGLSVPEIVVECSEGQVDYLASDPIYNALFLNVNIKKSFIDQHFSKQIMSRSGLTLHTNEPKFYNHKRTQDIQPEVLASHFLNEQLAKNANLRDEQTGITHSFAMFPEVEDSIVFDISMAELVREIFNRHPLKYTFSPLIFSDDFKFNGMIQTIYHLVGMLTHQSLQVLNFSEKIKDPFFSVTSGNYISNAAHSIYDELQYNTNGKIVRRARTTLDTTYQVLSKIDDTGFFESLEEGLINHTSISKESGIGADEIFQKSRKYFNPFLEN